MLHVLLLCVALASAAGAATFEADSTAVAGAARAQLGPGERIYRVVPVPESAWSTAQAEYLVDLAPREPGEIKWQLVATRNGEAWEFRRHRWMYVFPPHVSPRAVILRPPVGVANAGRVLEVVAPQMAVGERPVSIQAVPARDDALRIFRVMTASTAAPGYRARHFTVLARGDSVFVFAVAEGTQ